MTVEAAVIVPCTVLLLGLLLVLFFFVHNRNWYEMAAWESSLKALGREGTEGAGGTEAAAAQAEKRIREQPLPGSRPSFSVQVSGSEAEAVFSGQKFPLAKRDFSFRTEVRLILQRPAERIREAGVRRRKKR
jgi:hypothetical protein